jgi:hypothetical protein
MVLNLRDNIIRDKGADELINALKTNTNIIRLSLELNPVKHVIFKEIEALTKRNQNDLKGKEGPQIKYEITMIKQKQEEALSSCPYMDISDIDSMSMNSNS